MQDSTLIGIIDGGEHFLTKDLRSHLPPSTVPNLVVLPPDLEGKLVSWDFLGVISGIFRLNNIFKLIIFILINPLKY